MKILVTGAAGFIGFNLVKSLIDRGDEVIGFDNINNYYDIRLKYRRLENTGISQKSIEDRVLIQSDKYSNYCFVKADLTDSDFISRFTKTENFDVICNLAAQAGVRYSIENPKAYINSNIIGFYNILEASRQSNIKHLVYASSSSVYGLNESIPFSIHDNVDHPISLYAASKKSNELMAHSYSHLFKLPTTGLRFFTVYGPWGRPDMALFLFTKAILENEIIDVYNNGEMYRDFTYIDDIVKGIKKVIDSKPTSNPRWSGITPDPGSSSAPYKVYNIGNNHPVKLTKFIELIEDNLGKKGKKNFLPMQPGDVPKTNANIDDIIKDLNYKPKTNIQDGIKKFIDWYKEIYNIKRNV